MQLFFKRTDSDIQGWSWKEPVFFGPFEPEPLEEKKQEPEPLQKNREPDKKHRKIVHLLLIFRE